MCHHVEAPLAVIVPTRGRPENAKRLFATGGPNVNFMFVVDRDDPKAEEYIEAVGCWEHNCQSLILVDRGRPGIVDGLNQVAVRMTRLHRVLGFMGDDHLPRTDNWAWRVALELPKVGILYGNDLLMGEKIPTAAFMTANIVEALGYMAPPELAHLFVDNYWLELGKGIGSIKYLPDLIIEHIHPLAGKSDWDPTYEECNNPNATSDRLAFEGLQRSGRLADDIAKIKALM